MSDDQFAKLYNLITEMCDKIDERLAATATKDDMRELCDIIRAYNV